jgi:hypothetical protein
MTHMGNYANDRLALYTFESVIKFVKCWTNLQLKQITPLELGIKYFEMFNLFFIILIEYYLHNYPLCVMYILIWNENKIYFLLF